MTVAELIAELQKMDPTRIVVMQKDAERNGYSPLEGVDDNAAYSADSTWSGDVGRQRIDVEDRDDLTEEDLAPADAQPCVVLWPVN